MAKRKNAQTRRREGILTLDNDGQWVELVTNADGTTRLPTDLEREAQEQRFQAWLTAKVKEQAEQLRKGEEAIISDPAFRVELTERYKQYLAWVSGADPGYRPTKADLWMRKQELSRKHYQDTYKPAAVAGGAPIEPLTEAHQAAFDLICSEGPLLGKEICNRLGIDSESNFTAHYVPELKRFGVLNRRGLGYYHPDFYNPNPPTLGGKR